MLTLLLTVMRQVEAKTLSTIDYTSDLVYQEGRVTYRFSAPLLTMYKITKLATRLDLLGAWQSVKKGEFANYDVQRAHLLVPERCLKT
jgi:hypothetical protein